MQITLYNIGNNRREKEHEKENWSIRVSWCNVT